MSAASNFLENAVISSTLRGAAFPTISKVFVALHTNDPGDVGGNEVTSDLWPAYARQDAAKGGGIASGWTAPVDGVSKNAMQLIFPVFDGTADLTVTHFSLYDAVTGGNMLVHAPLQTQRTVQIGDVFVVDSQKLTVQCL